MQSSYVAAGEGAAAEEAGSHRRRRAFVLPPRHRRLAGIQGSSVARKPLHSCGSIPARPAERQQEAPPAALRARVCRLSRRFISHGAYQLVRRCSRRRGASHPRTGCSNCHRPLPPPPPSPPSPAHFPCFRFQQTTQEQRFCTHMQRLQRVLSRQRVPQSPPKAPDATIPDATAAALLPGLDVDLQVHSWKTKQV